MEGNFRLVKRFDVSMATQFLTWQIFVHINFMEHLLKLTECFRTEDTVHCKLFEVENFRGMQN